MPDMSTSAQAVVAGRPGISWGPVVAGAAVATATTILLVALGSGFGLTSVSARGGDNPSVATFTAMAAIWLLVVQWISSFFGGYLAGRLRPGWTGLPHHEVAFRDTASGFVTWALSSLLVVGIVSGSASSLLGTASKDLAAVAPAVAGSPGDPGGYLLDTLFRSDKPRQPGQADTEREAGRIMTKAAKGSMSPDDHDYLSTLVATRTGISKADAGTRIDNVLAEEQHVIGEARKAADAARKAAASLALYTGFSMLVGAFIACVAGAIGGRQRDSF